MEQTADWEVQAWNRWQVSANSTKFPCLAHSESSIRSEGLKWAWPRTPESMDISYFPVEPGQDGWVPDSEADESASKWSWSWPSGRGENRRDSQEPTGGTTHRKGSQQVAEQMEEKYGHGQVGGVPGEEGQGRRDVCVCVGGVDGQVERPPAVGLGVWDTQAGTLWSSLTSSTIPRTWRPEIAKYSLLIQVLICF